jgi:hypothetical protein
MSLQPKQFFGNHIPLTKQDILRAADKLSIKEPAIIATIVQVEAGGAAYFNDGRPKILFEAHKFGSATNYKYNNIKDPKGKAISSKGWNKKLYGSSGSWQYTRLELAMKRNNQAALESTSWGAFQILGANCKRCGFNHVDKFVLDHIESAGLQLDSFVAFIKATGLSDELQHREWARFAKAYNGAGYKANKYDTKLAQAYASLVGNWASKYIDSQTIDIPVVKGEPSRSQIAKAQAIINASGIIVKPLLAVDGWWGPKTVTALKEYQKFAEVPVTGKLDDATVEKMHI